MAPKSKAQRRREWWKNFDVLMDIYRNFPKKETQDRAKVHIDAHIRRGLRMARKGEI